MNRPPRCDLGQNVQIDMTRSSRERSALEPASTVAAGCRGIGL